MLKQEIIDEIDYILKKHDFSSHKAIIEAVANDVYNQLIYDTPPKDLDFFEFITKDVELAVTQDVNSERYYSSLDGYDIVQLKNPQQGVVAINSKKGTGFRLYPTTEKEVRLSSGLESGQVDIYYGYYVHRDKIWYVNYNATIAAAGVRASLALQFKDFALTDEVPLPSGRNYDFVNLVVDFIRQTTFTDLNVPK